MNLLRASSTLRIALVLFVSLFLVGCGSGGSSNDGTNDFVFTGNNGQAAGGNSSLTFNFVRAQAALNVPADTIKLRFRFYSDANGGGILLLDETRDYADRITFENVNNATQSVIVTALSADGFPIFQGTVPAGLIVGGQATVDFANATTQDVTITGLLVTPDTANIAAGGTQQFSANLSFSNGEILPANNVVWTATGQASVDVNNGLVTATTDGIASVTGTRDALSDTSSIIVGAGPVLTNLTVAPDNQTIGTGSNLQFSVTGTDQNNVAFAPLTGVVWSVTGTATIDADTGLLMAPNEENAVVTATVGTVSDSTNLTILNSVPTIMFGNTAQLDFLSTESPNIADAGDVTVTDDMPNLDGGTLIISPTTPGNIFDATFTAGGPNIGTIIGQGTATVLINLNTNATPADIAAVVEATTISFGGTGGTGTIQVRLTDGQGNSAAPETRAFSVPDPIPVVTLDVGLLSFLPSETPLISPTATVTDDLVDLNGGTLAFSVTGTATDVIFNIPAAPAIGVINNNSTGTPSVTLDANATPANITTVLQGVTIAGGPIKGTGTIQVDLSDTDGNNALPATRDFEHLALSFTVADMGVDFTLIQAAVDAIAVVPNAQGSTITVLAGYTTINEMISVGDIDSLDGLTILGVNAGIPRGVTPGATMGSFTVVEQLNIEADGVTLDGLDFSNITGLASNLTATGTTIQNCFYAGSAGGFGVTSTDPLLTVLNSNFQDLAFAFTSSGGGGTFMGNSFQNNILSLFLSNTTGLEVVTGNGFSFNVVHLLDSGLFDITVSGNDFNNDAGTVSTTNTGGINAQGNWWGADADPTNPAQVDDGMGVNGAIDFSNRLNSDPFPAFP